MPSVHSDTFESFAAQAGLEIESEPLTAAPRDVLTPLADVERHFLITLTRSKAAGRVRLIFVTPAVEHSPPSARDVLWWLAADAWAVERSSRTAASWASTYGYPAESEPTLALYRQHVAQADALKVLLGVSNYDALLALYESEVSQSARK
ncbi:MAG: hypothetical protein AB1762_09020 [Gemmatimonadota bacterium]